MVSRIGLASGYGAPAVIYEKAFHEYGVNFFWLSAMRRGQLVRAIRNLTPSQRDEIRIALALPTFAGPFLQGFVRRSLKKLEIEKVDLFVLQGLEKPPDQKLADRMHRLRESGLVRFVGVSSHKRSVFADILRGDTSKLVDFHQIRYNAVHTGAEEDVFPHLPQENRPGILTFTATCWGRLLKPKLMPEGERPPAPADCFRFVLSHPDVNICLTGPSNSAQMEANLEALAAGPLDEEEMTRIRRVGKHIYSRKRSLPFWAR